MSVMGMYVTRRRHLRDVLFACGALFITGVVLVALLSTRSAPAAGPQPSARAPESAAPARIVPPTLTPGPSAETSPAASVSVPATPGVTAPVARGGGFVHPGVFVSASQLNFVRERLAAGAQPWRAAFDAMMASPLASLSRMPQPRATVECGSKSNPNHGCTDERNDALAAYTLALAWYFTGDERYAEKATAVMDAWARVVRNHTNSNAKIQAGWSGVSWARAGELIRYTYRRWPAEQLERFSRMLREVYLSVVVVGEPNSNGNHELIEMDAAVSIAVFLDDRASYLKALTITRARIPAYIYLTIDGPRPRGPQGSHRDTPAEVESYWHNPGRYVDGLSQETCRDFGHTGWGFSAAGHIAATAWIQGTDLYAEIRPRLTAALEFHAGLDLGDPVPGWLCGGTVATGLGSTLEVAYNHYHGVLGLALPNTGKLVSGRRPAGANYFLAWETLTHAGNPFG
ncbi:alginate lyase family protein [Dactylosporangium sp. AC04546]|uniref:alginate lyase family protein n=1 Tax=Dactylosporangium sp. AC04546 TaxID=2862460 RepID=UPI001EDCEF3E|nr:alginate lyase family protein [Dactylosporangium sp. AC04546]WVK86652.1 alginate lyase family protein [Dactylosporangium sp. AC04546]